MANFKTEIRQATETDIDVLLSFEKNIVADERLFDSTLKEGEIHYYNLIELIRSDDAKVLVAVINKEIVGSGYAKILLAKEYEDCNEYAYLGFMYVKPDFRGNGINKRILNKLIEWARKRNISEVRLQVYDENVIAKNAYLKFGFKPHTLIMRTKIEL